MSAFEIAQPAVTMSEAQAYVRIETGEEEAVLAGLIRAASALCESFLNQVVIAREFSADLVPSGSWQRLGVTPVRSIDSVEALDTAGLGTPLPATGFAVDIDSSGDGWIRVIEPIVAPRIRVHGNAGMASRANDVPEPIRQGVIRLVAHLYSSRDGGGGDPPAAVTALWRPYRRMQLR